MVVRGVRRTSANGGEHRLLLVRNQQVGGSSPLAGSILNPSLSRHFQSFRFTEYWDSHQQAVLGLVRGQCGFGAVPAGQNVPRFREN